MPSIRIDRELNDEMYFVTLTIKNWYYIFDRHQRWPILADSLKYCQKYKGLKIYAYVFMLNHLHLIIQANDTASVLRDFKKFTAKRIYQNLLATEPAVAKLFDEGEGSFRIWQKTNMPKIIETNHYFQQKLAYIHDNPVRKEYVSGPEYWYWSSAGCYINNVAGPIQIEDEYIDMENMWIT